MITCHACKQELRVTCPDCGRLVLIVEDKKGKPVFSTHERTHCTGSHLEWKTCAKSDKSYVAMSQS